MPPPLQFHPPLVNSACPWATDLACLKALLDSPSTGAVTTRTSLLAGFDHQPERHRFTFFDPGASNTPDGDTYSFPDEPGRATTASSLGPSDAAHTASLNTLGYSPIPLQGYLDMIRQLASDLAPSAPRKTFIVSVTGSPDDIAACYAAVAALAPQVPFPLALEVNLSCPNIPGRPPPAYDPASLRLYLAALPGSPAIPLGFKTPPYTHAGQYQSLLGTLREERAGAKLSFITATNTLGSCLVMTSMGGDDDGGVTTTGPALPLGDSGGIGGMAGPPLHPLALGNVATIRRMLDEGDGSLRHIAIVGVGGVSDGGGYRRMRAVGASMVGVGTGLGSEGVDVFAKIERDIGSKW
ncbi:unnamed protein product [Clonostachys rhizophaga]|uniref:Dihydroorotate dehydrogenase (fumarate) n=1 Tax=Clonostachys rhizophaga TaxID=160324 RepID=A0A9N9VHS5_9HYPO|nr:unnamed protein product [Clonostachys rhizophaga]